MQVAALLILSQGIQFTPTDTYAIWAIRKRDRTLSAPVQRSKNYHAAECQRHRQIQSAFAGSIIVESYTGALQVQPRFQNT